MRARVGVVALIGGVLACGCGSTQRADPASGGEHPPVQAAVHPVLVAAVRPVLAARIHVPAGAVDVVASDDALWVAGFEAVSRLDPATGRVVARIRTPGTGDYSSIATGEGSVWVTASEGRGTVYRIDPSTNRVVATVHVTGSVQGIAVGAGRVWVTRPLQGPGDVIRIDPHSSREVGAPIKVGPGPTQVVYGQHAVWVQNTSPASVMRIDPATGHVATVVGTHAVNYGSFVVGAIAVGYGSLWTAANDSLTRIDPRTSQVQASVGIPRAQDIAIGHGEVWVLAAPRSSSPTLFYPIKHTAALWQVDPSSNRVIGKPIRLNGQTAITASYRSVWVADYSSATVTRFRLVAGAHGVQPSGSLPHAVPAAGTVEAPSVVFSRAPYMGVACHIPNSIACDRVGLAVWLRQPAIEVSATIAGAGLKLNDSQWSGPAHDRRRTMFAGFLQPAGLTTRLHLTPDPNSTTWMAHPGLTPGPTSHGPLPLVRFRILFAPGKIVVTRQRIPLAAGWG